MVAIACALLAVGYTLGYVAISNLAHGPGKGVGFAEAIGLKAPGGAPLSAPASSGSRPTAPGNRPRPGSKQTKPSGGGAP